MSSVAVPAVKYEIQSRSYHLLQLISTGREWLFGYGKYGGRVIYRDKKGHVVNTARIMAFLAAGVVSPALAEEFATSILGARP